MNNKNSLSAKFVSAPYVAWAAIFIAAPLVMVFYYTFTNNTGAFTLENIIAIPNYTNTIMLSVWLGFIATAFCLIAAYPIAYIIATSRQSVQRTLIMLTMLPMWMNFLIRTYSWMSILEDNGIINTFITKALGLAPLQLINTRGAVVLGMVYNFLPYMILPLYSVMTKLDYSLVEAAEDLGGNKFTVFKSVILPLSIPGIVSGITMVFVPSVSTFYISQKLGGTSTTLIGDIIEMQFQTAYNYHLGAALSFVLMILIFISLAVMKKFSDDSGEVII
ncbi:MAG TPA: ABC transporter permease [Oscillospiraceae bacterium]|nr:ABC transporter permease [Oscillospiraceae bacterium]